MRTANSDDNWRLCAVGQLQEMVQRQQTRRRQQWRRRLIGVSTGVSVVMVVIVAQFYGPANWSPNPPGKLTCDEVQLLLADFVAGKLDAGVAQRVRQHLDRCPDCRQLYRQRYSDRDQFTMADSRSHSRGITHPSLL